jgi:hypothetical protein
MLARQFIADTRQPSFIPVANERAAGVPVVPPGWDPRLVDRVSHLEGQVDKLNAPSESADAADDASRFDERQRVAQREQERLEHYRSELRYRDELLNQHALEDSDAIWARPLEHSIRDSLSAAQLGADVGIVDCRSATCLSTLSFPSPRDALVSLRRNAVSLSMAGCRGFIAIPTPPAGNGRYELTVIHTCR